MEFRGIFDNSQQTERETMHFHFISILMKSEKQLADAIRASRRTPSAHHIPLRLVICLPYNSCIIYKKNSLQMH